MPAWAGAVLAVAAVTAALSVIWTKLLHPAARLVTTSEAMVPLLVELTEVFRDQPESFRTLSAIAAEFRSESGTTLREIVNRLELAALENHHASERLKTSIEMGRLLAERDREIAARDREAVQHLIVLLERLSIRAQRLEDERAGLAPRAPTRPVVSAPRPGPGPVPAAPTSTKTMSEDEASTLWDGIERRVAGERYPGPERRDPAT